MKKEPIPNYLEDDDILTIEEFEYAFKDGWLIDYDGHGYWSNGKEIFSDYSIKPSKFNAKNAPKGATHIAWFNR